MVHSGYEATAVNETMSKPLKALKVFLNGPKTEGEMAPEVPFVYKDEPEPNLNINVVTNNMSKCSKEKVA